jgi:hypothetical protein
MSATHVVIEGLGFPESTRCHEDRVWLCNWGYQAIGASPAMFRRSAGAGSLYWLGHRDRTGAYLNGSHGYRLSIPLPAPARLFWSVTVYDAETRSQIQTEQDKAVLSSLFGIDTAALALPRR